MARFGDMLQALLKVQDSASGESVASSNEATDLIRELNALGLREEQYQSWQQIGSSKINPLYIDFPYAVISSQVIEADIASITVNIPSNYKSLMIFGFGQQDLAATEGGILLTFNGDSGANYQEGNIVGENATGIFPNQYNNTNYILCGDFIGNTSNQNSGGGWVVFIPHYNSSFWKVVFGMGTEPAVSSSLSALTIVNGTWRNTNPITYLTLTGSIGNIKAGSLLSVYGIL